MSLTSLFALGKGWGLLWKIETIKGTDLQIRGFYKEGKNCKLSMQQGRVHEKCIKGLQQATDRRWGQTKEKMRMQFTQHNCLTQSGMHVHTQLQCYCTLGPIILHASPPSFRKKGQKIIGLRLAAGLKLETLCAKTQMWQKVSIYPSMHSCSYSTFLTH